MQDNNAPVMEDKLKDISNRTLLDNLAGKKNFVISGKRLTNEALYYLVDGLQKEGYSDAEVIEYVLKFDKLIESGELTQEILVKLMDDPNILNNNAD